MNPAGLFRLRPPRKISPRLSESLDFARWLAAALVVISHLRSYIFEDFPGMQGARNILMSGLFFISGFGHQAVIIFFVLSGYLVGGEVLQSFQQGVFDARAYAVKRVARLYAVYLAALALGGALDWVGAHHFNASGIYTNQVGSRALEYSVVAHLNWSTLLGNVIFCQGLLTGTFGSNAPLWSLANEAWYYLMFPLLGYALLGRVWRPRLICLGGFAIIAWLVHGPLLTYFSTWLLGVAPRVLTKPVLRFVWAPAGLLLGLLASLRLGLLGRLGPLSQDLLLSLAFVLLINSLDHASAAAATRWAGLHKKFAGFSYSLYLLHGPFIVLLVAIAGQDFHFGLRLTAFTGTSSAFFAVALLAAYGYAAVVAGLTERHTPAIRRWLGRCLGVTPNPS
jgi:peptidoglycan/LPS O-acetylase OafA/YrhL